MLKKKKNESHDIAQIFSIFFVQHHTHVVMKWHVKKPSCKTPAERKQVRQRGDGLSRIRIQQAINRSIFLKSSDEMYAIYTQKQIFTIPFFFFLNQICHITNTSEKHGEQEKTNRFCFIHTKALWSYCVITYIHYFRDRTTYWRESEIWPGILLLLLSSDCYVINIFSIAWLHISVLRLSKLWRRKRWVCGIFPFLWLH